MNLRLPLLVSFGLTSSLLAQNMEPSEYRVFTDKRDLQIEARILSISEDQITMMLQRQDGNVFETAITILSLDEGLLHQVELFSLNGQLLRNYANINAPQLRIERQDLPAGMYFYRLQNERGQWQGGKLLVQ